MFMDNSDRVREWRLKNKKPCPGDCDNWIDKYSSMCRRCNGKSRATKAEARTIGEVRGRPYWSSLVRHHARKIRKFDSCDVCGYTNHVEVCHIRPVSSFDDECTIQEVNAPSNLRGLCPNHHWELDNGLLKS